MTSRRELYAMGEPLGDCATRHEGGRLICGGGGDSSSSASTSYETTNVDARSVLDGNATGSTIVGNGNSVVQTDHGAVNAALLANSTNTDHLLAVAESLYSKTQDTLDKQLKLTGSLAATAATAYSDATAQATGNKSLILAGLAVVGVVAFVALKGH